MFYYINIENEPRADNARIRETRVVDHKILVSRWRVLASFLHNPAIRLRDYRRQSNRKKGVSEYVYNNV